MANTIGNNFKISIFGKSHGDVIGACIDRLPAGIKIDLDIINHDLDLRKPIKNLSTKRKESDNVKFLSGLFNGISDGTPLVFVIENNNFDSSSYQKGIVRANHSDYPSYIKYNGFNDYNGAGMYSGRMSAILVVIGAIFKQIVDKKIKVFSHIKQLAKYQDDDFDYSDKQIESLNNQTFPVINDNIKQKMENKIKKVRKENDSIGAIVETCILNLDVGIGEPFFDSIESYISKLIFSIGSIKGIEFGDGFDFVNRKGSEVLDILQYENDNIVIKSNHNGGINGGLSNGNPIMFKTIVKPTNSIYQDYPSIDLIKKENITYHNEGRHDPCIASRIAIIINNICYIALYDLYLENKKYQK